MWWHTVTHGRESEGETGEWIGQPVPFALPRNMVYPALLRLMCTPRLPVVDWTVAPADLNGLVRFAERRNLVSAHVLSHFNWPLLILHGGSMWAVNAIPSPLYFHEETPRTHCTGGWVGPRASIDGYGWEYLLPPPGFEPRTDKRIGVKTCDIIHKAIGTVRVQLPVVFSVLNFKPQRTK